MGSKKAVVGQWNDALENGDIPVEIVENERDGKQRPMCIQWSDRIIERLIGNEALNSAQEKPEMFISFITRLLDVEESSVEKELSFLIENDFYD